MLTETSVDVRHIVSIRQFDKVWLEQFLLWVKRHRSFIPRDDYYRRHGTTVYMLFYEPSTRTRFSFTHAATGLGIDVIATENAREFSSAVKGESLEDTIRVCCEYEPNIIILRHPEAFSAQRAVEVIERWGYPTRLINAGDGANEHPTQALTDLYTIWREKGRVQDLNVLVGGDLLYGRAARSLIFQLALFPGNRFTLFSPSSHRIGEDVKDFLCERGSSFREETTLSSKSLEDADVVYWTRPQLERNPEPDAFFQSPMYCGLSLDNVHLLSRDAIILHPLPRTEELSVEIDNDPRARYFQQAGYGKIVRTALMMHLLRDVPINR